MAQQPVYAYDTTWTPPQVVGSTDPNVKVEYNYDPVNTQVQYITVEQWTQIENDKSAYSNLWNKDEFTAEKFAQNQKSNVQCVDQGWLIAFWINFAITLVFMIIIATVKMEPDTKTTSTAQIIALAEKVSKENPSLKVLSDEVEDMDKALKRALMKAIGIGAGGGFVLTIIHFLYMMFSPRVYIKFGLWIGVIIVILICLIPYFIYPLVGYIFLGIAAVVFISYLCVYCCCLKPYVEFSCMVFEMTTKIERSHPMIFLVIFIKIIVDSVLNLIYSFAFTFIVYNEWSPYIYIYYLLSYYWAISTNYYVFYLISANLAANCYFLEGTEYFPENPLWDSVKRSVTKTFGSAACAGFIAAVLNVLTKIARRLKRQDNIVLKIIGCIALCILCCLKAIFRHISRYGLFYVTVYNVPFFEGSRRFAEISVKKFITTFMGESIVGTALSMNSFLFILISIAAGIGLGWKSCEDQWNSGHEFEAIFILILYPIFFIMFTDAFLWCLLNPADTISYALFICFTEYPDRLKVTNAQQYEVFCYQYAVSTARASNNEIPQKPDYIVYYQ